MPSDDDVAALNRFWADRSDEALEQAAYDLSDYTEVGQAVIREELRRRSIEIPPSDVQRRDGGDGAQHQGGLIYSHPDFHHVELIQGTLSSRGFGCEIRELLAGPLTERPWYGLCLLDESQVEAARRLVETLLEQSRQQRTEEAQASRSDRSGEQVEVDHGPPDGALP